MGAGLLPWPMLLSRRLRGGPRLWAHNDWHVSNLLWDADGAVATVLDFGLASPTSALFDLATAIERNAVAWLELERGADAVRSFAERRVRELEVRHADALSEAGDDPERRARVLAEGLALEGYAATARPVPGAAAIQLCQGHCPVQDVAAEFPELCEAEAHAFSRMLGVHVQRLATLANGGHVCTTNIPIVPLRRRPDGAPAPGAAPA